MEGHGRTTRGSRSQWEDLNGHHDMMHLNYSVEGMALVAEACRDSVFEDLEKANLICRGSSRSPAAWMGQG